MLETFWKSLMGIRPNGSHRARRQREVRAELEMLFQSAPVGMCVVDPSLTVLRLNNRFSEVLGIERGKAALSKSLKELLPGLMEQLAPFYAQAFQSGAPIQDIEVTGSSHVGDFPQCWMMNFHPLTDDKGLVWAVNFSAQDITSRKAHEQALARANQRVNDVLESINDGFVLFDDQWRLRYVNRRTTRPNHHRQREDPAKILYGRNPFASDSDQPNWEFHQIYAPW